MKKSIKLLLSAGMVILAASCVKENIRHEQPEDQTGAMVTETIVARVDEGDTKATINDSGVFCWAAGDTIAVHVSDGGTPKYVKTTSGPSENSASASFTVSYPAGSTRDAFAVYPASIVDDTGDNAYYYGGANNYALRLVLPDKYTLDMVSGNNVPCPMIADNTGSDWSFKQLCGVLRLTVSGIPSDATGLVIQFQSRRVTGEFFINTPITPGESKISNKDSGIGGDRITVDFEGETFTPENQVTISIPLPTGSYADVTVAPVGSSSTIAAIKSIKEGGYTAARAHGKKLSVTMTAVSHYFSVSPTRKVIFSKGNLQYTKGADWTNGTWSFMANQYDVVESSSVSYANNYKNQSVVGLFGFGSWVSSTWTTDPNHPKNSPNNTASPETAAVSSSYPVFFDDFSGMIQGMGWRTLTSSEWYYLTRGDLMSNRPGATVNGTANAHMTKAKITVGTSTVQGLIIFPDNYAGGDPDGVVWGAINNGTSPYATTCTAAGWEALETAGCVFLPAAGRRVGGSVDEVNDCGYYWSRNPLTDYSDSYASFLECMSNSLNPEQSGRRDYGRSVRLVHDVN